MKYDIIVIGSGPGGYVAAIRAAQLGFSTAVIEREELGGICLNWGCIPTKALLKSAQAMHYAHRAAEFGFAAENIRPDLEKIVSRSREVSATMNKGIGYLFKKNGVTLIKGTGRVLSGKSVEVTSEEGVTVFEAERIILATGSHPASLPFAPIDGKKIISYRQALVPQTLPKSLAVIGSGAIGSELAFFYRSLGVEVTLIEFLPQILPVEDEDVSAQVSRSFRKMGMKVMVSSSVKSVDTSSDLCCLKVDTKRGEETVYAEQVLSAAGVRPNTDGIGLEELGVEMTKGKVVVDEAYRTNVEGLFAIGDIIATPALAHVASAEAVCCVEGIAGLSPKRVNYDNIPGCTYISPEVASVGMTEKKAKELGLNFKVGKFPFTASGKAVAAGARDGFVKLVIDADTDLVRGAHLVGDNVSEMIAGIVVARNLGAKASDIMNSVFPHPTMSEAIMEAAAASHNEAIHI
ncbi:MAG: dihydrolipoyl dehydrogenase [Bacteroidales bacterium]|nr:dihydrolipoyl dehydrogenase [Candidatus Cacconaster merdequi]